MPVEIILIKTDEKSHPYHRADDDYIFVRYAHQFSFCLYNAKELSKLECCISKKLKRYHQRRGCRFANVHSLQS